MSASISKRLIDDAVRFHGHLGPFLILGLKAGLFANEVLGRDSFKTKAIIETEPTPPCSCFVDGVQFATGCTMGKGNIKLKQSNALSVHFIKGDKSLTLCLKNDILASLEKGSSIEELEETALSLSKKPISELFDITK